jgi:hypothetical protein
MKRSWQLEQENAKTQYFSVIVEPMQTRLDRPFSEQVEGRLPEA